MRRHISRKTKNPRQKRTKLTLSDPNSWHFDAHVGGRGAGLPRRRASTHTRTHAHDIQMFTGRSGDGARSPNGQYMRILVMFTGCRCPILSSVCNPLVSTDDDDPPNPNVANTNIAHLEHTHVETVGH